MRGVRLFSSSAKACALSATALPKAVSLARWNGPSFDGGNVKNFIGGEFVESKSTEWIDLHDPVFLLGCLSMALRPVYLPVYKSTQTLLSRVPQSTSSEFEEAVNSANNAFKSWSRTSVLTRQKFVTE